MFLPAVSAKAEKQGRGYFHIWCWEDEPLPPSLIPTKWEELFFFFLCLSLIYKGKLHIPSPGECMWKGEQWYACPYPSSESTRESIKGGRTGRIREAKNEEEKALRLRQRQPHGSKKQDKSELRKTSLGDSERQRRLRYEQVGARETRGDM